MCEYEYVDTWVLNVGANWFPKQQHTFIKTLKTTHESHKNVIIAAQQSNLVILHKHLFLHDFVWFTHGCMDSFIF